MPHETEPSEFPQLADALRQAYTHGRAIPSDIDRRISAMARERFAQRRRLRMTIRWAAAAAGTGLAAVIALAIVLHHPRPSSPLAARGAPKTFNMVDALVLAKHLAAHDTLDRSSDVNNDGVVDQKDVEAIAAASVSLKQTKIAHHLPTLNELGLTKPMGSASAGATSSSTTVAQVAPRSQEALR